MLWLSAAYGQDLSTPERRAGLEQALREAVAAIGDPDVRRHYEIAVRERVEHAVRRPAVSARRAPDAAARGPRRRRPVRSGADRALGEPAREPAGARERARQRRRALATPC